MSSQFSKILPSFIPLSQKNYEVQSPPPQPPNRKSSCTKTTIRVSTKTKPSISSRHEYCFHSPETLPLSANKHGTTTLRKHFRNNTVPISRSKSAGTVSALMTTLSTTNEGGLRRLQQHHARLRSVSPSNRQLGFVALRKSSRSPVAFGRSISKERTFAEEKKRLESTLPPSRTNFEASTNILRDPSLKSPQDVKEAVRSYATCNAHVRSKSLPRSRHTPKNACTTVNTTMRHTMCFPQISPQNGGTLEFTQKQAKRKVNTLPMPKTRALKPHFTSVESIVRRTTSQESLPRTNSTFSVDSIVKQEFIKTPAISTLKHQVNKVETKSNRETKPLRNSKSDSYLGYRRVGTNSSANPAMAKPQDNPVTYTSKTYLQYAPPYALQENTNSEPVREKKNFWNKYNAQQQAKSLTINQSHHVNNQYIPVQSSSHQYCSINTRSFSPQEEELTQQHCIQEHGCSVAQEPKCIEDLVWKYEQNSKSKINNAKEATLITDIARPQSPQSESSRRFSPTREIRVPQTSRHLRSPSRRRIDSCRSSSYIKCGVNAQKVIRASSLSSADDRSKRGLYICGELAHSATSLNYQERHSPTCRYGSNSERFTDLNRFYNTLERIGQLERATSVTSFKPIRKNTELLDFEEWRKVRLHERAEKELHYLVDKLKCNQRDKDMVFRSKDVEDVKWRMEDDFGLHSKDKSVEDLRENFEQINLLKNSENLIHKNFNRTHWRRNTVANLATNLHQKLDDDASVSLEDTNCHLSSDLVSTLSKSQIKKISQQLNDIYSLNCKSDQGNTPSVSEKFVVTVERDMKPKYHANTIKVRSNSSITNEELLGAVLRKKEFENAKLVSLKSGVQQNALDHPTGSTPLVVSKREGHIIVGNTALKPNRPPKVPPRSKPIQKISNQPKRNEKQDDKKIDYSYLNGSRSLDMSREKGDNILQKIQYFEERQYEEPPKVIYHAREDSSPDESEVIKLIEENMKVRAKESCQRQHKELSNSLNDMGDIFGERHTSRVNFQLHPLSPHPPDQVKEHGNFESRNEISERTSINFNLENTSQEDSIEYYDAYYRSPCLSPQSESSSTLLHQVYTGDVQKIREKFESIEQKQENQSQQHPTHEQHNFFGLSSLRKVRSDPEFNIHLSTESKDTLTLKSEMASTRTNVMPSNENEDFVHGYHKQCVKSTPFSERSRRGQRGAISPSLMRNRFMPHIDIISKSAALKLPSKPVTNPSSPTRTQSSNSGIVERIRNRYETPEINTIRYLSTSHPDLRNVQVTPPHLTADWIAHKFPNPNHNNLPDDYSMKVTRKLYSKPTHLTRSNSSSPPRPHMSLQQPAYPKPLSSLRPLYNDIFANQNFDPYIHQPKARYVPDGSEHESNAEMKSTPVNCNERFKKSVAVTFKG